MARRIRATDANAAGHLEEIVTDMVHALVRMEQRALRRKLDPGAVLALVFFTAPAAVGFVLALDWDSPWQLPVLILTAAWFLIWLVVGLTQLWGEGEEPQAGADPT